MPRGDGHITFDARRARSELGVAAPEAPLARKRKRRRPVPRAAPEPDEDYYDLSLHDLLPDGLDPLDWQLEPEPAPEPEPEPSNQLRVTSFFVVRKVRCISQAINFSPLKDRRRTATAMPIALPLVPPPFTAGPVALECHERLDWDLVEARGPLFVQVV
tara:strand:- start:34 stop:510 length:477 start_codon:yes stop_codon:yes gene_type:complete